MLANTLEGDLICSRFLEAFSAAAEISSAALITSLFLLKIPDARPLPTFSPIETNFCEPKFLSNTLTVSLVSVSDFSTTISWLSEIPSDKSIIRFLPNSRNFEPLLPFDFVDASSVNSISLVISSVALLTASVFSLIPCAALSGTFDAT